MKNLLSICLGICCAFMVLMVCKDGHLKDVGSNITNYHFNNPATTKPEVIPTVVSNVTVPRSVYETAPEPDTTIVLYKPEVRQPVSRVVVIDERYIRLKAEHEVRMRNWTSGLVVK